MSAVIAGEQRVYQIILRRMGTDTRLGLVELRREPSARDWATLWEWVDRWHGGDVELETRWLPESQSEGALWQALFAGGDDDETT